MAAGNLTFRRDPEERADSFYRFSVKCDRETNLRIEDAARKAGMTVNGFVQRHFETILDEPADDTGFSPDAFAREHGISGQAARMWNAMRRRADAVGVVSGSVREFASAAKVSAGHGSDYFAELADVGLIKTIARPGAGRAGTYGEGVVMNARFSDYVTSGAFSLTLTRNQISELAFAAGGERRLFGVTGSLERKGLIEPINARSEKDAEFEPDEQHIEWRLTSAGALTLSLLAQAGLSNAGADVVAREIDDLRESLSSANARAHAANLRVRSMHARLEEANLRIDQLEARLAGDKIPIRIIPPDPLQDASLEDLMNPERTLP